MKRHRALHSTWVILATLAVAAVLGAASLLAGLGAPQTQSTLIQPPKWWTVEPRPGYAKLEKVGMFQDWFEVYRLTPDTYAIYEPYQFQEAIAYLVIGSRKAVLIDTLQGIGNIRDVVTSLTKLPISVILTHEHTDHWAGASPFEHVAIYNLRSVLDALAAGVPNDRARRTITGENVWKPLPKGVDPETFSVKPVKPDTLLQEGQIIDLGGRQLEVIFTPGHAKAEICLLDRSHRMLFTGDHFYPGPLYLQSATAEAVDQCLASFDKIAKRVSEYDHVLGGHNEPWIDSAIIPRVSNALRTILAGGGEYSEDNGLRRYTFDGFDVLVRAAAIKR